MEPIKYSLLKSHCSQSVTQCALFISMHRMDLVSFFSQTEAQLVLTLYQKGNLGNWWEMLSALVIIYTAINILDESNERSARQKINQHACLWVKGWAGCTTLMRLTNSKKRGAGQNRYCGDLYECQQDGKAQIFRFKYLI